MADISQYLADIMAAVYGEDVRSSIHDAIDIINQVGEVVLSTGTAVTGPTSSSTGFFDDSLYLNTSTYELWKCVGTDSWSSQGVLKGADGVGIASIDLLSTVGLVDTYEITYTDGSTPDTFTVTNGKPGNSWYYGANISGMAVLPTVYPSSGIADAKANDGYLNTSEGAVYHCVTGGDAATATWSYDFTMVGGGGVSNLSQLNDVDLTSLNDGQMLVYDAHTDPLNPEWVNANQPTVDQTYDQISANAQSGTAVAGAIAGKADTSALDSWSASATVAGGQITFSGIDDTNNNAYEPYFEITAASTNKNPTATINTVTGIGTASMSVTYDTDADTGATGWLRIIK